MQVFKFRIWEKSLYLTALANISPHGMLAYRNQSASITTNGHRGIDALALDVPTEDILVISE